jgi:hypothetical protein
MSRRRHRLRISEDAAADMRSIAAYIGAIVLLLPGV